MRRREFVRHAAIATGAAALGPLPVLFAEGEKKFGHDRVPLGKTGIMVSRLAMGTGTHGIGRRSNQTEKLGVKGLANLLQYAFDEGVNFWDSADQYGTHPHLREALKSVSRNKTVILTKTHASTATEMRNDLDRFRRELGTDYLDIVLLHMMTDRDWPDENEGAMEVLSRAREEGIIRAHGVSCHTLAALETAAEHPWVQVDLARINPARASMDSDVPTVVKILENMHASGKGVIGMKIFGAGQLTHRVDECLRYVLGLSCVDAFTIGQESRAETADLLMRMPRLADGG